MAKAGEENLALKSGNVEPDVYDEHELHISEHIRFLLSAEFKKLVNAEEVKTRFLLHIAAHKKQQKDAQ